MFARNRKCVMCCQ